MATALSWNTTASAEHRAPTRASEAWFGSVVVVAGLALGYWLTNYALPGRMSADMQVYVARPLFWGALGLISFAFWRRTPDRPTADRTILWLAALAGGFNIAALICAGVLLGFGHSPYSRGLFQVTQNIWYLATFIFALEMSRAYLLTVWGRWNSFLAFLLVSLIVGAVWFAPGQFESAANQDRGLQVFGRTFMPGASESVMASFLASLGGPVPAFIYHLSMEAFRWVSPILPQLEWQVAAFVGTLAPTLAMLIVRDVYGSGQRAVAGTAAMPEAEASEGRGVSPLALLAGSLMVALIWINTGVFGFQPFLVSGHSMEPNFTPGDVVFARDIDPSSLKVGDIIRVRRPQGSVMHRIIEMKQTRDGMVFVTKGDNNNTADAPITEAQVEGKIVFEVPYVGWAPIAIKNAVGRVLQ